MADRLGDVEDISALKAAALTLNAQALTMAPTQSFGDISGATTISGGAVDGVNVIDVDKIQLKQGLAHLTTSGDPDEYFIINVQSKIEITSRRSWCWRVVSRRTTS